MVVGYEYRPGALYLNVTNRCSNDCTFCVRQGPDFSLAGFDMRLRREPSAAEVLDDIARQEDEHGGVFDEVVFCGFGEPTYRLDLIEHVGTRLRARGIWVRLNTNGQAALIHGRDPLAELVGAVDEISVSLNAPDVDTYVRICQPRHGLEAFEAVVGFVRRAAARFDPVTTTVVGAALDTAELGRCEQLAERLGVPLRIR